jgi:DNA/RNA endonuclease YhcR with UshA esterase domain
MRRFVGLACIVVLTASAAALADGNPPKETPQNAPTTRPVAVSLSDDKALQANMGKEVTVEGVVSEAAWSVSGRVFLIKFKEGEETSFQGALFAKLRDEMEKAFKDDLSDAFEGAKIQIQGKLQTYREHPEILINDPKQIMILVKGPGHSPHATTKPSSLN